MQQTLVPVLEQAGVVPVIVVDKVSDALPLAQALVEGGLNVLEVTLRTEAALAAVEEIAKHLPDAYVGTGTVLTAEDIRRSVDAGATFMVSPGATEALLDAADNTKVPLLPGASNPSEVMRLLERGYHYQKFFPAEAAGGIPMLKSIGGPLGKVKFCPTGGISPKNASDYLGLSNVVCVGGSWMVAPKLVAEKNWAEITRLAREASLLKG
ncbi:bifunctional 4-hydroxy-2-oxoglutarate aldolase/2-dehydro-3-deoxy-phosphogluconate aldolase [Microbulbifer hydrolyticus]|uniref:2-dehydro-3-deoxy-phosphogluconate aldolase n=1 Tax=Microbulbifer hydrolyticus TaxID=48074 RepID=A0A6P1T6M0_9GAMM|nr:bifunctional 4-hydroxy-2-oxoglutarate aldolase/2-dehydro-3-deoxy-phosphogluconate aldolase [Microbulbifer hydrolyticus]MBB5212805.1 2-dehydro-3-deoxyphosphogluconate aldolase/(4S)-4-hydroxy-2-oxoglutarate aldolase [Microbulbifer hydrolyticus]QHQ38398.1 bifunctional 4-hydroxy-2-oxoglutarate aldolase/2-dehydro-3-deoxy-phosphogluconate aldolase [Microbulbifer hydrolyticus]